MSIFTKFGGTVMLLLILATGSLGFLALQGQQQALTREALLRGQSIAINLAATSSEPLLSKDPVSLVSLCVDATHNHEGVNYAALVDSQNTVVGHPDPGQMGKTFQLEKTASIPGYSAEISEADVNGSPIWDISVPVLIKGSKQVLGKTHVGLSRQSVEAVIHNDLVQLGLAGLVVMALGLILSFGLVRVLVKPIRSLASAAQSLGTGNLEVQVAVNSRDEIGSLASAFNAMVQNLKQAEKTKLEKERMQSELDVARSIQDNLLPKQAPPLQGLKIAFACQPAKELGGDFYDCFLSRDYYKMGFVLADVSGKGVPAALHMANLRNLIRFVAQEEDSPRAVLKRVNQLAYPDFKGESFVTLVYGLVDPRQKKLTLANAGHDPLLLKRNGQPLQELKPAGMPIGLVEPEDFDAILTELSMDLEPGDLVVAYTDGVTEAMDAKRNQFGMDRLKQEMDQPSNPNELVARLLKAVAGHAGGVDQSDDITVLSFQI